MIAFPFRPICSCFFANRASRADHLAAFNSRKRDLRQNFELIPATSLSSPENGIPDLSHLEDTNSIHGVILHFSELSQDRIDAMSGVRKLTAELPTIVLTDRCDLEAIQHCHEIGIDRIILCEQELEEKVVAISSTLRSGGFRKFLIEAGKPPDLWPLRMKKIYTQILASFPKTQSVSELIAPFHRSHRTFAREFSKTFGMPYLEFKRALRIYEAWHLMQYTHWDHSEIAFSLLYKEEAHFVRDCRKQLGLNPTQMRQLPRRKFFDLLKKNFSKAK